MAASYDDGSVLRRRQRTTTTAASYDDGRRQQRHDKGDCRSTKATAVCVDGRQWRIVRGQGIGLYQRKTMAAADIDDDAASYEDNGIGLYRRKTTAAATNIDGDAIGGSISLVRGSKQQSTDDQGEEMATTIQRPMGDGGGEIQQSAIILGMGDGGRGLEES